MIDIRSDTVTKPSVAMRAAISNAQVGDDFLDGDPTTGQLEAAVALLLGKERALFFPSGTMANQAAIWVLSERGTEVLADANSHMVDREFAGAAALSGVQIRAVQGDGPMMDAASLSQMLRPASRYSPRASLVCLENTHNSAGGLVTPLAGVKAMAAVARTYGAALYLDGARLWNACVAAGTSPKDFGSYVDLVGVSFSKGLGAPAGAVLAGTDDIIARVDEHRRRLGGVMRQSGILAAGALFGLNHNMDRLADDHRKAADFARTVDRAIAATVVPPETNIIMIDLAPGISAADVAARAQDDGVKLSVWTPSRLRAVMHLDVSDAEAAQAAEIVLRALDESWRALGDTSEWSVTSGG